VCVCSFVRVFVCHTFYYKNACFVNKVSDVGSWWNFQISFWRMIPIIWHHLHVHQEPPCPPRLQEETWRTGGVLTGFLMKDNDVTSTKASEGWYLSSDTASRFIRNLNVLQNSRKRLGGQVESWQGFWCWILMKLSQKLLKYDPYHMTPPPGSSGTSTSSKTPGRDLEDRWSLDRVCDVGSWWNLHRSFWSMIPIIWHHLQVYQEPPHPPRLQGETWRTGGVLTGFLMLDLDETFTEASEVLSLSYDTTSRFIRNLHILQDSRERLWGQVDSWHGFWFWILMKLSQKILNYDPYHMTPPPGSSGTSTSSKTSGRNLEDRLSLGRVSDVGSLLTPPSGSSGTSISSKTPGRNLEDRWSFDGFLMLDLDENFTWIYLWVHLEPACPFKDSTKRHGRDLIRFLMLDLDNFYRSYMRMLQFI